MINLPDNIVFKNIADAAAEMQQETCVIGGYVRDLLLGRQSKDIDIVTLGSGINLAKNVAKRLKPRPSVSYFKKFGTAHLEYNDFVVEFVGARKESF